jgi:beta-glucosidase
VGSVMASYNEIDGVPSHINHWLLDKVLRQEWGFKGVYHVRWRWAADAGGDASRGVQQCGCGAARDCGRGLTTTCQKAGVQHADCAGEGGHCAESDVDRAVAKVLTAKFRLGLFDNPYVDPDYAEKTTNSEEHRKLAD